MHDDHNISCCFCCCLCLVKLQILNSCFAFLFFLVAVDLKNLIIKLLRKNRKTVHLDKWEHALAKFCYGYSSQDAWEIERFGYKKASLTVKLRVLKVITFII